MNRLLAWSANAHLLTPEKPPRKIVRHQGEHMGLTVSGPTGARVHAPRKQEARLQAQAVLENQMLLCTYRGAMALAQGQPDCRRAN